MPSWTKPACAGKKWIKNWMARILQIPFTDHQSQAADVSQVEQHRGASCSCNELVGNWLQHDRLVELGANKVPRVRLLRLPAHKHSHQTTQFTTLHQHTNYRLHTTPHQPTNNYYTARQKKGINFVLCASLSWQKDGDFFTYIKECISYNSVHLVLTCVKNFA